MQSESGSSRPSLWRREFQIGEILTRIGRWKVAIAIVAGACFRVAYYLTDRFYWMDEASLANNVDLLMPGEFFGPLRNQQLAPPDFLVAEWVAGALFGHNRMAMRLVPLLCGIASLFLFLGVARRCLRPRAVFPAMMMFACSDDLIYFSSEMKQYSSDLASSLACLLLGLTVGRKALTPLSTTILSAWGLAIVWFSHTSIFALAAVGVVGLWRAIAARDLRWAGLWLLIGASWLVGFSVVHGVAVQQLGQDTQMWAFWNFAFPPMPPTSAWEASWILRRLAYFFINPLNFDVPFARRISMIPAIALAIVGGVGLWKDDRSRFALLMLPVAFVLLASSQRAYPFHGRLVLFLAPTPLIAIAAGLEWVRGARGRGLLHAALVLMVLIVPALAAVYHLCEPRNTDHNSVGDRRDSSFDPIRFPY